MRSKCTTKVGGFTLIEVLVVTAIMTILAGILFGVFSRVREKGRSAVCQSNLHQIYLAVQQYVQDNDGWYPPVRDAQDGSYWPYRILPYIKNKEVFFCPDFQFLKDRMNLPGNQLNSTTYNFNAWRLNAVQMGPGWVAKHEAEVGVRLNPTITWLNYCMNQHLDEKPVPEGKDLGSMLKSSLGFILTSSCGRKMLFDDGTHHSGGTNWSFLDGHVKWMTMQQAADMDCANPPLPPEASPVPPEAG